MKLRALVIALPFAAYAACGGGTDTGVSCPPGSTLTYANFGKAFMQQNCTSCHGGREEPSLTTVESIRSFASDIDEQAGASTTITNTRMPERGSVSVDDRRKLSQWLACGAP